MIVYVQCHLRENSHSLTDITRMTFVFCVVVYSFLANLDQFIKKNCVLSGCLSLVLTVHSVKKNFSSKEFYCGSVLIYLLRYRLNVRRICPQTERSCATAQLSYIKRSDDCIKTCISSSPSSTIMHCTEDKANHFAFK